MVAIALGGSEYAFCVAAIGNGAPAITIHPASQFVSKGQTVRLHVRAAGVQPMFYQWQLEGVNIAGATNADLVITNMRGKDAGNYRAIVFNALGAATSRVATLTIPVNTNLAVALNATNLVWDSWSATNRAGAPQITTAGVWFAQTYVTHDDDAAAQSGAIGHNQQSVLQTTVTGPGTLTFWWRVSSELGYDFLRFYVDNFTQPVAGISGETDWQQVTVPITEGSHLLRWVYVKDGSISTGQDAGWVDEVVFVPNPPVIGQHPSSVVAPAGNSVSFVVGVTGAQPLTYQWLKNGTNLPGANSPVLELLNLTRRDAGTYAVMVCNPSGCVTSSNAVLTVLVPQRLSAPAVAPDGSFVFTSGDAHSGLLLPEDVARFDVQASTDLIDWANLPGVLEYTNGMLRIRDPWATNYAVRFYRLVER
ncbi:MAG: immunoglobulin domain-containing protein [Verrucomicrobiales bacterium]|nr:immunoglobulin domain-containing protein [Verrucomicrobiales bacterium]